MCAAGPCLNWFTDADADDVCDMLPLITVNDNSVIAKEVTFEASEFLPPVFEETDLVLYNDHQLVTEINEEIHETSSDGTILTQLNNEAQYQVMDLAPIGTVIQCASSSHLHLHRKVHLAHKPYPCTYGCDRRFSSSGNRQKHIARMHTHEKKYRCTNCNESFIYARQLQIHRERKHSEFRGNCKGTTIFMLNTFLQGTK
uniref:C2H2-type domain-containing protein n=1 Tax=Anopheles funestus TaxID=62324 RepID=A0A182RY31_ANOFN